MDRLREKFYMWLQGTLKAAVDRAVSIRVEGLEHFPAEGPAVLVCNHRSDLDPLLLAFHIPRPVHWMARAFLFNIPVFRELLWAVDAIPISRKPEVRQKALEQGARILKEGGVVGIFPEGIDAIGDPEATHLHTFHTGFARMALSNHAPIVPAAIIPEEQSLEPVPIPEWLRKMWGFEGRMKDYPEHVVYRKARLLIGEPIRFEGPINYRSLKIVATQTREVIYHMLTEGVPPPKKKGPKKKASKAKASASASGRKKATKAAAGPSPRDMVLAARKNRNGGAAPVAQAVPKVRKLPQRRQWPVAPMPGAPVEE